MIRVEPAPAPDNFDTDVRQPGLSALAELVGEPTSARRGPKRQKIADRREDIPATSFPPFWRAANEDLLHAYRRICSYSSLYIPRVTGAPTVDHMIAKSLDWRHVYEWTNYRLACALVNTNKGAWMPIDPFEIQDAWFALELVGYQVVPGDAVTDPLRARIDETINKILRLNDLDFRRAREKYAEDYLSGDISYAHLERHAPFVARELRRRGKLLAKDLSSETSSPAPPAP